MFELIFIIIIFSIIKNATKKKKNTTQRTVTQGSRPVRQNPPRSQQGKNVQRQNVQQKPAKAQSGVQPASGVKKQEPVQEKSTTDMLREKALQDDREEMRDKHEQRMKNKKYYGGHNYAQKYLIGDPVPKDKRMVYCSYCNAENLIPTYSRAGSYNCYFCREEL